MTRKWSPDNTQEERLLRKMTWIIPMFSASVPRKSHPILAFNIEPIDTDATWSKIPTQTLISLFLNPVLVALLCSCPQWTYFIQDRRVPWVRLGISYVNF